MSEAEAYSTLNMGAGYVAIVSPEDVDEALRVARKTGHDALVAGEVDRGRPGARHTVAWNRVPR